MRSRLKLLILPANPIEMYSRKGIMSWYRRYINPGNTFSTVHAAYVSDRTGEAIVEGIPVITVRARFFPADYLRLLLSCIRLSMTQRISVIRAYCAEMPGLLACIVGRLTGIPVIVSVHGHIDIYMKERGYSMLTRVLVELVHRFVYLLSNFVWCVGDGLANSLVRNGANPKKITIIYNKVDTGRFQDAKRWKHETRSKLGIKEDEVVLIHVGRLSRDKRIDRIIRTLPLIKQGNKRFRLVLIGPTPGPQMKGAATIGHSRYERTYEDLRALARRLDVEDQVLFLGRVSDDDLIRVLGMSDIYISAATGEGFGIAIAEAQAASLPVIATKELMIRNRGMLVNPQTSLGYSSENPKELAAAIVKLAKDDQLRQRLISAGTKESSRFQWERIEQLEANSYIKAVRRNY